MFSRSRLIVLISALLFGVLLFKKWNIAEGEEGEMTIGIIQTATHPALNQAKEGFIKQLTELTKGKARFVVQNAEGSLPQAQSIAESFHAQKKIKAIFAIGTPALQAAIKAEKTKPIFHAAVSYPETLAGGPNVAGVAGRVNTSTQAEMIKQLFPQAKTIAILHNPGDHNSQLMAREMMLSLEAQGFNPVAIGVHSESEIAPSVVMAARKAEIILLPTDNLLASAITLIAKESLSRKIPLIASDTTLVEKGACAAQGINYSDSGKQTAKLAERVLIGKEEPRSLGHLTPEDSQILLNETLINQLNIEVPPHLLKEATLINGGSNAS